MNLGGNDDTGSVDITVTASPALPRRVTSDQITIEMPQRPKRIGEKLETEFIDDLAFSAPRIIQRGKLVAFSYCVDGSGIEAGTYVGQLIVGGPEGVEPATLAVTVNRKDGVWFWIGWVGAGLLAFALLALRDVTSKSKSEQGSKKWNKALRKTLRDYGGFWGPTVIGVGAALAAMYQVYAGDVSWGADPLSSILALAGTAISAAGLGTFISSVSSGAGSDGPATDSEDKTDDTTA